MGVGVGAGPDDGIGVGPDEGVGVGVDVGAGVEVDVGVGPDVGVGVPLPPVLPVGNAIPSSFAHWIKPSMLCGVSRFNATCL